VGPLDPSLHILLNRPLSSIIKTGGGGGKRGRRGQHPKKDYPLSDTTTSWRSAPERGMEEQRDRRRPSCEEESKVGGDDARLYILQCPSEEYKTENQRKQEITSLWPGVLRRCGLGSSSEMQTSFRIVMVGERVILLVPSGRGTATPEGLPHSNVSFSWNLVRVASLVDTPLRGTGSVRAERPASEWERFLEAGDRPADQGQ